MGGVVKARLVAVGVGMAVIVLVSVIVLVFVFMFFRHFLIPFYYVRSSRFEWEKSRCFTVVQHDTKRATG